MNQTLPNQLFPLFVTSRIPETRAFYTEKIGCELTFDMPDYLQAPATLDAFLEAMRERDRLKAAAP